MAATESIVLGSSSPLPDRRSMNEYANERDGSQKENIWPRVKPQTAKYEGPPPPPVVFQGAHVDKPSTVFKVPPKYSPSKSKHLAIASEDVAQSTAKKPRLEGPERKKPRAKKQTKSTRTVTRTVLDKYDAFEDIDAIEKDQSTLDLATLRDSAGKEAETADEPRKKRKATKKKTATAKPAKPKLLDPETAHRSIGRQEVFFGTSSQLVRDETLEEVRDLQEALRQSEAAGGVDSSDEDPRQKPKALWVAGARGDEDSLIERDLDAVRGATLAFRDADFIDIDDLKDFGEDSAETVRPKISSHVRKNVLMCLAQEDVEHVGAASRTEASVKDGGAKSQTTETKPVKRPRGRPRKDQANDATNSGPLKRPTTPKPSKGAKNASNEDAFLDLEEIEDSDREENERTTPRRQTSVKQALDDDDETVTVSMRKRGRRRKVTTKLAPTSAQEIRNWETEAPVLYRLITQAVKSAPSGRELCKPSWHEKMLLYDPICLEDLTEWLNGGPLERACKEQDASHETRWEGQAEVWKVKFWCEHHSVCCFNKEAPKEQRRPRKSKVKE